MIRCLVISLLLLLATGNTIAENSPYRSDVLWVTTPNNPDWRYALNEQATVDVALYHYGILQHDISIHYTIGPDMLPATSQGSISLTDGKATIAVGTMQQPGFRDLRLSAVVDGETYTHHIKLGFDPQNIQPFTTMPEGFDAFWQQQKQLASAVPMEVERTWVAEFSDDQVDCYLIKLQAHRAGQYVYGYLTIPKREGRFPVVFSPPGAGIKPMTPEKHRFYAEQGVIRFDMEIHGIRPNLDKATYQEISSAFGKGNNSYLVNGLDDPYNYYMKKAYLSSLRALDYLTSLPEWDGKNLIAQGGSQGGALALITAALDERITAVAANHPALSDMAAYTAGRTGGYPHLYDKFSGMDTPAKRRTLQYYDVVNFARRITVPVFMTWGFNDDVCPPTTSYAIYNVITADKQALVTPINEHWVSTRTRHKILNWIKSTLK
ncbi:acetylxylan esterase [Alteromonas gilva]|uniref:Acetylxylan esterase n=1 Tax=Alteromonas gilva TaxID=2987522 RepID=A0ABT5KXD8_9ALTE|nr:acetylxylan esterase [Alteromonas gilva]MDC8829439.1 acetylxylan esterase [Alteromonas gilva]